MMSVIGLRVIVVQWRQKASLVSMYLYNKSKLNVDYILMSSDKNSYKVYMLFNKREDVV